MNSISRVIEKHGDELREELLGRASADVRPQLEGVALENRTYTIQSEWQFVDGSTLPGPQFDIDELVDRFPDCEVSY